MGKDTFKYDISYTQNRELSWLRFNERVLEEAVDPTVPIYEKLKFVSIFTSNLDEFFMIRVGSLHDLSLLKESNLDNKCKMTPGEQLEAIFKAVAPLYKQRDKIYSAVEQELREYDIYNLAIKELENFEKKYVESYFENYVMPVLSPQIMDQRHPFPHLENKSLNIAVTLKGGSTKLYGIIPVPKSLPRILFLPGNSVRYVLAEKIILEYAERVFDMYDVVEKTVLSVTRNADINPDDEAFDVEEDYRHHMRKILKKRARLAPVRLELQGSVDADFVAYLRGKLNITKEQVFKSAAPLDMSYVYSLNEKFPISTERAVTYAPYTPQVSKSVRKGESMIRQIMRRDILLSYPYEQMEPFLRLIKESAVDPNVISIKITIYRLSSQAKLMEHLITAAENNKDVTVLMELRARFDEQNNIDWSARLEESGCRVIYGLEGFKVHSKICLITLKEKNSIKYVTQIGTGNYNEKTAKMYTDLSLMTANSTIGNDAVTFFKNMAISNLNGEYKELLVAPANLKRKIISLINEEIQKGTGGRIIMKMNSLTDRDILDKLHEASDAGVRVDLIIRGICCLLPEVKGKTENIRVTSIVGRYLEHSRVFCFGEGAQMKMYLSSADMMTRNTQRRVEIACPVWDSDIKNRLYNGLQILLKDTKKARRLLSNGQYVKKIHPDNLVLDAQQYFMDQAMKNAQEVSQQQTKKGFLEKWRGIFRK